MKFVKKYGQFIFVGFLTIFMALLFSFCGGDDEVDQTGDPNSGPGQQITFGGNDSSTPGAGTNGGTTNETVGLPADAIGSTLVKDFEVGDCFIQALRDKDQINLDAVSCTSTHTFEMIHISPLEVRATTPSQIDAAVTTCNDAYLQYLGARPGFESTPEGFLYVPTQQQWDGGERNLKCAVRVDLETLNTVKDTLSAINPAENNFYFRSVKAGDCFTTISESPWVNLVGCTAQHDFVVLSRHIVDDAGEYPGHPELAATVNGLCGIEPQPFQLEPVQADADQTDPGSQQPEGEQPEQVEPEPPSVFHRPSKASWLEENDRLVICAQFNGTILEEPVLAEVAEQLQQQQPLETP